MVRIAGAIKRMRSMLPSLWDDVATITRRSNATAADTIAKRVQDTVIADNVPCQLSWSFAYSVLSAAPKSNEPHSDITLHPVMICAYDTNVLSGDKVSVTMGSTGETIVYTAGEPAKHASHKEVPLIYKGMA